MFDKIIGFIGAATLGSAMIQQYLKRLLVTTGRVIASALKRTLDAIHSRFSIETTLSNETVAERSDILFLAVKPNKFDEVIPQIAPHVKSSCIIVSIAAGKTIAAIEKAFGKEIKLVRAAAKHTCPRRRGDERPVCQCTCHRSRAFRSAGDLQLLWKSRSRTGEPH